MSIFTRKSDRLVEVLDRLDALDHQADLIKMVLTVKHPDTSEAATAFEGLRKQILAATAERRSHLAQLVAMSVAVRRATSVDDLVSQVREWREQSGVVEVTEVPTGARAQDLFEDVGGEGLDDLVEVVEPAYVDSRTDALVRLGRARKRAVPAEPFPAQHSDEETA